MDDMNNDIVIDEGKSGSPLLVPGESPMAKVLDSRLLLYRSNNFWKAPWKSYCVSVLMTFVTASFISSIVS